MRGEIIEKDRVTHDLSFPGIASKTSINERMDRDKFSETHYGHMHKRLLRSIVNTWENYPTTRILIRKDDFKSAYQQQHLSAQAAIQSATQINWKGTLYVLLLLRLAFGEANGSAEWSKIAEPIADIRNALLFDDTWEPQETQAPNQDLIHLPSSQGISIPFAHRKPLAVNIPVNPQGNIDIYLDSCITIIADIGNNRSRGKTVLPLAIQSISQPFSRKEPVLRDEMIKPSKEKS